jgi:hypothetical protein
MNQAKLEKVSAVVEMQLKHFMSRCQLGVLAQQLRGEEGEYFADLLLNMAERIANMHKTYEQDGKGGEAIVHLHYFLGSLDAWITEKDKGDESGSPRQIQAYGVVSLAGGIEYGEMGYVSIEELIRNGVELDLHWEPKTLNEVYRDA